MITTIQCSSCHHDLPPSSFAPFRRVHGGFCRACDAIHKRTWRRHYSGLSPAEALGELWERVQKGKRIPKQLQRRVDQLVPGGALAA